MNLLSKIRLEVSFHKNTKCSPVDSDLWVLCLRKKRTRKRQPLILKYLNSIGLSMNEPDHCLNFKTIIQQTNKGTVMDSV